MSDAAKNRRSFSMAYLLAQCAPPLKLPDKQPTAYFYGHVAKEGEQKTHTFDGVDYVGAVLPPLPERDETVYPYAVITRASVGINWKYMLWLCSVMPIDLNKYEGFYITPPSIRYGSILAGDETWGDPEFVSEVKHKDSYPRWSNFDFYYTDYEGHNGELCLAASYPIDPQSGKEIHDYGLIQIPIYE